MLAVEFIKSELSKFVKSYPKVRVRGEFDSEIKSYFIEIVPSELFNFNELYIEWEKSLLEEFIMQFPNENLFFISDDALVGLDRIDFELYGTEYQSIPTTNNNFAILNVCHYVVSPFLPFNTPILITSNQGNSQLFKDLNYFAKFSSIKVDTILDFDSFGNQQFSEIKGQLSENSVLAA